MNKYKILKCSAFVALVIAVGSSKALAGIDLGTSDTSGISSPSDQMTYIASASFEEVSQNPSVSLDYTGNISFTPNAEFINDATVIQPDTVRAAVPEPMATAKLAGFSALVLLFFVVRKKFTVFP